MKSCIITGIVFLLCSGLTAGGDFRYLLTQNGLPDGEVNSIVQDSSGNMWLATWTGLVKYDGYSFEVFRPELGNPNSLPEKKIKLLFVDSKDNLWIATSMNLCRYNSTNKSFITYRFSGAGNRGINISGLDEFDQHLVVHAVEGIFMLLVSASATEADFVKVEVNFRNEPVYRFINLVKSAGDRLLLVANNENKSTVFYTHFKPGTENPHLEVDTLIELDKIVNDIEPVTIEKAVYIATSDGIISFQQNRGKNGIVTHFQGKAVCRLLHTSNNHIYFSSYDPSLQYLDLHTGLTGKYNSNPHVYGSLLDNEIQTLYEDFSGNLWIGHQGQGISILNLYQKKFHSYLRNPLQPVTLNSNTVMCFEGNEGEIIIGCRSNGINIVAKSKTVGEDINYLRIPLVNDRSGTGGNDGIWDIARQNDSLFWIGSELGLFRLDKTKAGWKLTPFRGQPSIPHSIRKVFIDKNNNIWCGTHGFGLYCIPSLEHNKEGINFQYEPEPENPNTLSDGVILDMFLDSEKRFWVGTNQGLNLLKGSYENLDLSGKSRPKCEFKRIVATQPVVGYLNNNEINCFFENYDGKLWIATQGGGINILDPETEQFSQITIENGLPSDDVISMVPDEDGNLWISTNKGLVRYNRFGKEPIISAFNSSDGLQGEVFMINSYYKAADGQLFFGGDKGFTSFYPREIKLNEIKPKICFTDLRIKNKIVKLGDTFIKGKVFETVLDETNEITLPYKSNVFSIGTSALHFQDPESNGIMYKLKGIHKNWITIPATVGNIYLSNIPAGKYTLLARAVSSDGLLSDEIKEIGITIRPPWYGTGVFVSFYILAIILVSYGIIYFFISRQKHVYQKEIDKMTIENNEQKMLFLTNIAHELRTPLSLIIGPVKDMVHNVPDNNPWKGHLQLISRNSNFLLRLINQIIDFRKLNAGKLVYKPQNADVTNIVRNVAMNFVGYESSRNIELQLKLPEYPVVGLVDVQKYEEVLYNLLSNAYKHTPDHGSIIVSLALKDTGKGKKDIHLIVFNEGNEISEEFKDRIFERFYKVDESTEGAGIGLSFSKSLVEMHKGTITVESVSGKGVAFNVIVPQGEFQVENNEQLEDVVQGEQKVFLLPGEIEIKNSAKESVLIVEDNSELREFLVKIFARNYSCYMAENGSVAWEIILKNPPSLVLSDIIMPETNGLNLCKKIKENKNTCHIPVLLLTAKDAPEQISEGFSVGADSYVTKPFDTELLLSQAGRLIQNRELIKEKYRTQNFMIEVTRGNSSRDEEFVQKVKEILEKNISDPELNVNNLSQQLNISTTQLYRKLKELTGHSPVEFIRTLKLQKAYMLLNNRSNTVKEVCYLTGFNNMSYFIKCFREHFGVTPAHFRDNGKIDKPENITNNVQF